jgi:hypothetical protein
MPLPHVVNALYMRFEPACLFWEVSAHVTKNLLRDSGSAESAEDLLIKYYCTINI